MPRLHTICALILAGSLLGCASAPRPTEKIAARAFSFPIEGQLASISLSDLAAIVRVMQPNRIYRLRVINHNRVEADTSDGWVTIGDWSHGRHFYRRFHSEESPAYMVVERVHGVWETGMRVVVTY